MIHRYYAAYGSNLSVQQMAFRAPDARPIGAAVLHGWRLSFKVHATIEPDPPCDTPILVWEISEDDEERLDCYEGYPSYYYKQDIEAEVIPLDGKDPVKLTVMVYIMSDGRPYAPPSASYYKVLEDGYRDFGFPVNVLKEALLRSAAEEKSK